MRSAIVRKRQLGIFLFFLVSLSLLLIRLIYLQVLKHNFYVKIANEQHAVSVELEPKRGAIFDRSMRVLAININCDSIFANARLIKDKDDAAKKLAPILGIDEGAILEKLSKDKAFVWIKRRVTPEISSAVKALKITGIDFVKESKRVYPNKNLACHIIGTANIDNVGLEGLELVYNKYLKGESGWLVSTRDAKRKTLESYQFEYIPPKNGFDLVLTIDEVIQNIAERELAKSCQKFNAKAGCIVVMDPLNGDILALANYPAFDLNDPSHRVQESIRNRAVNDFYEPGSVFKVVTASALLEEKAITPNDVIYCENGKWNIGSRYLNDVHPYGNLKFSEVIEKSSNIGTVKSASRLGPEKMYKYMKLFGIYETTGIDLPGEVTGINRPVEKWSKVSMYAIPMGQEVTVTAMQLARIISVIADNGCITKPRIVKEIVDDKGETIKAFPPKILRRVISPMTAWKVRQILKGVVERGTGKKARIEDCIAGGKTGTGQKVVNGTYSHDKFIGSFIGFAPADHPKLAIAVSIDEPHPVYYGGDVAAPVFKVVADEAIKYMSAKRMKR